MDSSEKLAHALTVCKEMEEIGKQILYELNDQREKIGRIRGKTTEVNKNISKSSTILENMKHPFKNLFK